MWLSIEWNEEVIWWLTCPKTHWITLDCIALHYLTTHHITSHHITLHYIGLHYMTLQYIRFIPCASVCIYIYICVLYVYIYTPVCVSALKYNNLNLAVLNAPRPPGAAACSLSFLRSARLRAWLLASGLTSQNQWEWRYHPKVDMYYICVTPMAMYNVQIHHHTWWYYTILYI
jgi:hypothetical protein